MRILLTSTLLVAFALPGSAQNYYVNSAAAPGGNGTSWSQAFDTVQAALTVASSGQTVWVATGFYTGTFQIPAGVTLLGTFIGDQLNGPVGHISLLQRDFQNRTTLSGLGTQRVVTMGNGAVLDGFWIQQGQAAAPGGGGALVDGVAATFRNCVFRLNNDSAGSGAALLARNGADVRVENSLFFINGDVASGAAIDVDGATGTFINLTVDINQNSGIRLQNGATPKIYSSTFTGNGSISLTTAYGIEQLDTSVNPVVENNLFHNNNSGHYMHGGNLKLTAGQVNGMAFATANIEGDPLYNGPNDYRLQSNSPCIDAGHATAVPQRKQGAYNQSRRLDGDLDGRSEIDIGAAEFTHVTLLIPVDVHRHVHVGIGGTPGLSALLMISVGELPGGLYVPPVGYIFANPVASLVVPYGSIPTPATQVVTYPPGVAPGITTYWHALTGAGSGFNVSNIAVHITN